MKQKKVKILKIKSKYLLLFLIFFSAGLLFYSCSEPGEDEAYEISEKICKTIKENTTPEGFRKAGEIYTSLVNSDKIRNEMKEPDFKKNFDGYLKQFLRGCFVSVSYKKHIPLENIDTTVYGSAGRFLKLRKKAYDIEYEGTESPAFRIYLKFLPVKPFADSAAAEVKGRLMLLGKNGDNIGSYNISYYPNMMEILKGKSPEEGLTIFLAPLWENLSEDNFSLAAESMEKMDEAESLRVYLDIFDKNGSRIPADERELPGLSLLDRYENAVTNFSEIVDKIIKDDDLEALAVYKDVINDTKKIGEDISDNFHKMSKDDKNRFDSLKKAFRSLQEKLK